MGEELKKLEFGGFFDKADFEVFTWKIPNISSIPHVVDNVVQSPSFSFGGTSWILKMYPYGRTQPCETEGYIDITIERLQTQGEVKCTVCYINIFNKEVNLKNRTFVNSEQKVTVYRFMKNINEIPEKWQISSDDSFSLVIAFSQIHKNTNEVKSQTMSVQSAVGGLNLTQNETVIGEVFKEYAGFKSFVWKVWNLPSFPLPLGYQAPSPQFSFVNATWILKIWPYYRMEHARKPSFDIVLERLRSEVPVHHIIFKIYLFYPCSKSYEESTFFGTSFFSTNHTLSEVFNYQLEELNDPNWMNLKFRIEIKAMKVSGILINTPKNSVEKAAADANKSKSSLMPLKYKALEDYKNLFFKQDDCDIIIKVKEQQFAAHRLILKARSPVLASTFRNDMKEKVTGIINIDDCDPSHFFDFLYFLYCGEVENLTMKNAFSLFTLADKYDVPDLRTVCLDFLKHNLSIDTFCSTITLALLHSEPELIKLSIEFFAKNLKKIIVTVEWQNFIVENPIQGNELFIKALVTDDDKV